MDDLTKYFKILSDETRLRILVLLNKEKLCVCQLCGILELSQPKVSKHLAKLRDSGMVKVTKEGLYVYYQLNIKDKVIYNMLNNISNCINDYNDLKIDIDNFDKKDKFLSKCKVEK